MVYPIPAPSSPGACQDQGELLVFPQWAPQAFPAEAQALERLRLVLWVLLVQPAVPALLLGPEERLYQQTSMAYVSASLIFCPPA